MIEVLPQTVARQDSPHYELIWRSVSPSQRGLLMALVQTPAAKAFSRDFQVRHGIGPSASTKASLDSLTKKGILIKESGGGYLFTDIFFPRWIEYMSRASGGMD